jgi:hypothetical protein
VLDDGEEDDPLDKYDFWRSFKAQVKVLRDDMSSDKMIDAAAGTQEGVNTAYEELMPLLDAMKLAHGEAHLQHRENAVHLPLSTEGMSVDPHNPFMCSGSDGNPGSAFSMFRSHVAQNKVADAKAGVWGRDMV